MIGMDSAWAPVVSGVAGGVIAAVVTVLAGSLEWRRRRADQMQARRLELQAARDQEVRTALRNLRVVHTHAAVRANDLANGHVDGADALDLRKFADAFSTTYTECVIAQEELRSLCASTEVHDSVDTLVAEVRRLVDLANEPPDDLARAVNKLSKSVRTHLRTISAHVDAELRNIKDA
ncbi:MAG: hypothetical protein ACRDP8_20245 [Actinopolymorphaceae bacterium]